ncbi:MAG: hypothetical protein IPM63_11530 [Acidobacteriota bacterium]|nr:MAG: hypothetical protein IPM63_11530 [Acidobacteriota bacterium]
MKSIPNIIRKPLVRFVAARSESCLVVTRTMSDSIQRRLSLRERYSLWLHSLICDACVDYLKQIRTIREAIRNEDVETEPFSNGLDDSAKGRISSALRRSQFRSDQDSLE